MTVTFCGHGDIDYSLKIKDLLYDTVEKQILLGADRFLIGGYGNFDRLSARVVFELKSKYKDISSFLVVPYLNREYDLSLYDGSIYPSIEDTPLRYAIPKRNQWMVDKSDVVIGYVAHSWGGAAKTLLTAQKKKKHIINLFDYF